MFNNFLDMVEGRTSCRNYRQDAVSNELINYCLEAARWSPSACNKQPWRFVIISNPDLRRQISSDALLPGLPMPWVANAPVIVVICAYKSIVTHLLAPVISGINYHLLDIGIAGEHFVLAAHEQGLGSCWIGWFNKKKTRKILGLPISLQPVALLTLGYPAEVSMPRSRFKLNEITHYDHWNTKSEDNK